MAKPSSMWRTTTPTGSRRSGEIAIPAPDCERSITRQVPCDLAGANLGAPVFIEASARRWDVTSPSRVAEPRNVAQGGPKPFLFLFHRRVLRLKREAA